MYLSYSECRTIIDAKPENQDLARWFSDQANHMFRVREDLDELKQEEKILKSEFKVRLVKIERRRREIRDRCRHLIVDSYLPGSTDYNRCNVCGDIVEL